MLLQRKAAERDPKITAAIADIAKMPPATGCFAARRRTDPPAAPWTPEVHPKDTRHYGIGDP